MAAFSPRSTLEEPSDNHGAAMLLLKFRHTPSHKIDSPVSSPSLMSLASRGTVASSCFFPSADTDSSDADSHSSFGKPRMRTVSMGSLDNLEGRLPVSPLLIKEIIRPAVEASGRIDPKLIPQLASVIPHGISSLSSNEAKHCVGETCQGKCRGVLAKKFSWKAFPELEAYLVAHRPQYLQYSSQLNYTSEQKRYNNSLTQGLLDLASESGYRFEGFTFAMIRDRIRCFYKSYVQAVKKKKRKKRR